ncbi:MAG: GNAT family N-acetyltransferase [Halodesulfurarchaeum sp.]
MTHRLFPERIETERLRFDRLSHETIDPFELYAFVSREDWRGEALDAMPWFRFQTVEEVAGFIDHAESEWAERSSARYLLRERESDVEREGEIVGTTAFIPDWETRMATADVVLAEEFWGREYGLERASVFVELTFGTYDLEAYCTSCATDNEPSRRMLEKLVEAYGGRYEGRLRQFGAPRPSGEVTDQYRFSIVKEEYERAVRAGAGVDFHVEWE